MKKYCIKTPKKDFQFLETTYNMKGSRQKRIVVDKHGLKAMFKYERADYIVSEACSEKMSYEIARILGYDCAKIELAQDENGKLGVLNYFFQDCNVWEHMDAISYLNTYNNERSQFYTISNIKKVLDILDQTLFEQFIRVVIFDVLVGEQDRHEENWGIQRNGNQYKISPLYDNGCNLLREFRDETFAQQFYMGNKDFKSYIERSKTLLYKEDNKTKYKHFELIIYLKENYSEMIQKEKENINKLTDKAIKEIVNKIPNSLLTIEHKQYIINYLIKRRDKLLELI